MTAAENVGYSSKKGSLRLVLLTRVATVKKNSTKYCEKSILDSHQGCLNDGF